MSTAPKLTYAKIGNKSKQKIDNNSSELGKNQQQKSQDLFAQMNQDNLNYIKKQLKLKKHRSDVDKNNNLTAQKKQQQQNLQEQNNQRDKILHKYGGSQQLSQKQPHLQQTQRKSSEGRPLDLNLPEDVEQEYQEIVNSQNKQSFNQKQTLMKSYNKQQNHKVFTKNDPESKMYHSLPYQQAKKRMTSIQGFCGQALSINLNRNRQQGPNFINFLQGYITDLNHSKHLKSKQYDQVSIQKSFSNKKSKNIKQTIKYQNISQLQKEQLIKRYQPHYNSDTFAQQNNNKYTLKSHQSYIPPQIYQLELQLKQERLNNITLAQQIQKLRAYILISQQKMKKLKRNNQLLNQKVIHLKKNQQIYLKNQNSNNNIQNNQNIYKYKKINNNLHHNNVHNENVFYQYQNMDNFLANHHFRHDRHASVNPTINRLQNAYTYNTYRGEKSTKIKEQHINQSKNLFKKFENHLHGKPVPKQQSKKQKQSLQRSQRQYQQFLKQIKKDRSNFKRQQNKYKQQFY